MKKFINKYLVLVCLLVSLISFFSLLRNSFSSWLEFKDLAFARRQGARWRAYDDFLRICAKRVPADADLCLVTAGNQVEEYYYPQRAAYCLYPRRIHHRFYVPADPAGDWDYLIFYGTAPERFLRDKQEYKIVAQTANQGYLCQRLDVR